MPPDAHRLSEASDDEMRALTGTSGVLCDKCGSTGHNTAGHPSSAAKRPGVMYAAVKWPVDEGPKRSDVQNDLEILALTLVEEHGWTFGQIEETFQQAIDTVEWNL